MMMSSNSSTSNIVEEETMNGKLEKKTDEVELENILKTYLFIFEFQNPIIGKAFSSLAYYQLVHQLNRC